MSCGSQGLWPSLQYQEFFLSTPSPEHNTRPVQPGTQPHGQAGTQTGVRTWLALACMLTAFMPVCMDLTVLHVAIPSLTLALQATGTQVLWTIDIYPLMTAGLLVPMGTLADRVGAKRMFCAGMLIFVAGSVLAAFAPSAPVLIAARACMGVASSIIMPTTLFLIRQLFESERQRDLALGLWSAVSAVGAAAGPLIGGFLIETFWWGAVFLINLPLILVLLPVLWRLLPRVEVRSGDHWPIGQGLLLMTGLILAVYAAKALFKTDVSLPLTCTLLVTGLVLLLIFVLVQKRAREAMFDVHLFDIPDVRVGSILCFLVSGALAGVEFTLAQELQFILGFTPLQAGIFMLPMMSAAAVSGLFAGFIVHAAGLRAVCSLTMVVTSCALAGLAMTDFAAQRLQAALCLGIIGFALGIGLTAASISIVGSVPREKGGTAGGIESFGYDLGTGLGITIFGLLLTWKYQSALTLPRELQAAAGVQGMHSLPDTMVAANELGGAAGELLRQAGRAAFTFAHRSVLLTSATVILAAGILVFVMLGRRSGNRASKAAEN